MVTDQELIDRLRGELAPLLPPADLIERLRLQAAAPKHARGRRLGRARDALGVRLRRPVSMLPVAISILLAVGIGAGALAFLHHGRPGSPAQQTRPAPGTLILTGDGLGEVRFGASPQLMQRLLDPLVGRPLGGDQAEAYCGIDRELIWPILLNPRTGHLERSEELMLAFDHGRFVGYQYGGFDPPRPDHAQRLSLHATTARGLALGDSLATGQRLYGRAFQISGAQGGSWQARTPQGTLRGYAYDTSSAVSPSNLVASIDGGDVGCPAMSP